MKVNWLVRVKHREWWVAMIPAVLLAAQAFAKLFGFEIDLTMFGDDLLTFVNALFAVLVIMGVVVDPTTEGLCDSEQALCYDKPRCANASETVKVGGTE